MMSVGQKDTLRVYEGDSYEMIDARAVLDRREIQIGCFDFRGLRMS
jgi:hypothetical protein